MTMHILNLHWLVTVVIMFKSPEEKKPHLELLKIELYDVPVVHCHEPITSDVVFPAQSTSQADQTPATAGIFTVEAAEKMFKGLKHCK